MVFSIDPNVKGAISESFDKSHLSESFDVPAGCLGSVEIDNKKMAAQGDNIYLMFLRPS